MRIVLESREAHAGANAAVRVVWVQALANLAGLDTNGHSSEESDDGGDADHFAGGPKVEVVVEERFQGGERTVSNLLRQKDVSSLIPLYLSMSI